jgi:NADH-quinone oxidoreductase subunit C
MNKREESKEMTHLLSLDFVTEKMKEYGTVEQVRGNRIRVTTTPDKVLPAIKCVMGPLGCDRLVTMSTVDNGTTFGLIYHFIGPHRTVVSVAIEIPRENPVVISMSGVLPPAGIYERQIHDLFGIVFRGHPGLKKIILNEDWPANEFPLRKDWKKDPDTYYGGVKGGWS